jgi:hypothetical protein
VNSLNEVVINPNSSVSSVEITKTSKGTTFKIKCYNPDIEEAKKQAIKIYADLEKKYPSDGE